MSTETKLNELRRSEKELNELKTARAKLLAKLDLLERQIGASRDVDELVRLEAERSATSRLLIKITHDVAAGQNHLSEWLIARSSVARIEQQLKALKVDTQSAKDLRDSLKASLEVAKHALAQIEGREPRPEYRRPALYGLLGAAPGEPFPMATDIIMGRDR